MDELTDPIVEEFRKVREAIAKRHNYDMASIVREIQEHERLSGAKFESPKTKRPPRRTVKSAR